MGLIKFSEIACIFVGAVFLILGLPSILEIAFYRVYYSLRWKLLALLIILFFLGYIAFGFVVYTIPANTLYLIVSLVFFGGGFFVFIISKLSSITIQQIRLVVKLKTQAEHDALTGIYNQRFFKKEFQIVCDQAKHGGPISFLLLIDLDKFKCINDNYGHKIGNEVLIKTAKILRNTTRKTDIVARTGGDEFALILYGAEIAAAKKVAKKISLRLKQLGKEYSKCKEFGCSIGISVIDKNYKHSNEIFVCADKACYLAKKSSSNKIQIFDTNLMK
jgi:diguanylate cyclase (GGDEF)-like protein